MAPVCLDALSVVMISLKRVVYRTRWVIIIQISIIGSFPFIHLGKPFVSQIEEMVMCSNFLL